MMRDLTYIDDIVEGIVRLIPAAPNGDSDWDAEHPDPSTSYAPYRVHNIGNNQPVALMEFIETLEKHLGMEARKEYLPMQPRDVQATYANIDSLQKAVGFKPVTSLDEGIGKFVEWYKEYYPEYFSVQSASKNNSDH